jgi:hypothetical protein
MAATFRRALSTQALASASSDQHLADDAGTRPMGRNSGNVLFWLTFPLVLAVSGVLDLQRLLEAVRGMIDAVLAILGLVIVRAAAVTL